MCNSYVEALFNKLICSSQSAVSAKMGLRTFAALLFAAFLVSANFSHAQLIDPNSDASLALKKKGKGSKWSYFTSSRWSRPLVSPAVETASFAMTTTYSGLDKFLFTANLGAYRTLVSESDDPSIDQSLTNLNFSFVFKKSPFQTEFMNKNKIFSNVAMGISLPTSESSIRNTVIGSVNGSAFFSKRFYKYFTLSSGLTGFLSAHKYENVRNQEAGNGLARGPFSYLGFSMPVSVSASLLKGKASLFLSYNLATSLNYDQDWVGSNSVVTSVSYRVNKKMSILGSYSWGDRIETDNDIFAAEAVRASAGIAYKL